MFQIKIDEKTFRQERGEGFPLGEEKYVPPPTPKHNLRK